MKGSQAMSVETLLWGAIIFIGGYLLRSLDAYLRKKGENLATREDIEKITQATKEIEAKISGAMWDRQKQWELKRDAVFDVVRCFARADEALLNLLTASEAYDKILATPQSAEYPLQQKIEAREAWNNVTIAIERALLIADVVSGTEATKPLRDAARGMNETAGKIFKGNNSYYWDTQPQHVLKLDRAWSAIRKELGIL
jgi:hypothetical protein